MPDWPAGDDVHALEVEKARCGIKRNLRNGGEDYRYNTSHLPVNASYCKFSGNSDHPRNLGHYNYFAK